MKKIIIFEGTSLKMKNQTILIILFSLFYRVLFSQSCLPEGITFTTQSQIDNFQVNYPGCTTIEGDVNISGSILNLLGLNVLETIGGDLEITWNDWLYSLDGLQQLTTIEGSLIINENFELTSLDGLNNLVSIGGSLMIGDWWGGNAMLTNLDGLGSLAYVGAELFIGFNQNLTDLTGLSNLGTISGELTIIHNPSLTSLSGLENIDDSTITHVWIYYNTALTDCNIQSLCEYLTDIPEMIEIYNNGPGCDNAHEIADSCGFNLSCLPYGNYHFVSQANIDSFPSYYPSCNNLAGYTWIEGDNITGLDSLYGIDTISGSLFICGNPVLLRLNGLDNLRIVQGDFNIGYWEHGSNPLLTDMTGLGRLHYIGGELMFLGNASLQNFNGLDSLEKIEKWFSISENQSLKSFEGLNSLHSVQSIGISGNDSLSTLNGLQSLVTVTFTVGVQNNPILSSLDGIENITADSMLFLRVQNNDTLSECSIQTVCDFLGIPESNYIIENNAPGCNNPEEVLEACEVGVGESAVGGQRSAVVCYPNPASDYIFFDFSLQTQSAVNLSVFNSFGQQVATIFDGSLEKGEHQLMLNAAKFPAGIYFYRLGQGNQLYTGKLLKLNEF